MVLDYLLVVNVRRAGGRREARRASIVFVCYAETPPACLPACLPARLPCSMQQETPASDLRRCSRTTEGGCQVGNYSMVANIPIFISSKTARM